MNHSDILVQIVASAQPQLQAISEETFSFKPQPEKWSKKEILGHLIDSAHNNYQRFIGAAYQDDLIFSGYAQAEWVLKNQYQNRDSTELITLWALTNRHIAQMVEQLSPEYLNRETTAHNFHLISMKRIPKEGDPSSLSYLIWDYLFHLEHHLNQILPTYQSINPPIFQ